MEEEDPYAVPDADLGAEVEQAGGYPVGFVCGALLGPLGVMVCSFMGERDPLRGAVHGCVAWVALGLTFAAIGAMA